MAKEEIITPKISAPELPKLIKLALPQIARGIIKAPRHGWFKSAYYDPITDAHITFAEPPTLVALTETRTGRISRVKAPRVSIPRVDLAKASRIRIPSVELPSKVTEVRIPHVATSLGRFSCGWAVSGICDSLNDLMKVLERNFRRVNKTIDAINDGLKETNKAIRDLRNKTQSALNTYRGNIESGVNAGFEDDRDKVQTSINTLISRVEYSTNRGLSRVIPTLYGMIGLPRGQLISQVSTRNIRKDSFEYYSLSKGMVVHYIAVGKRPVL